MGHLEQGHHHTVVAVVVVIQLVGRATASGEMASIFQVLPTYDLSVSFSVPPTTPQNCRPVSIFQTTMTFLVEASGHDVSRAYATVHQPHR